MNAEPKIDKGTAAAIKRVDKAVAEAGDDLVKDDFVPVSHKTKMALIDEFDEKKTALVNERDRITDDLAGISDNISRLIDRRNDLMDEQMQIGRRLSDLAIAEKMARAG